MNDVISDGSLSTSLFRRRVRRVSLQEPVNRHSEPIAQLHAGTPTQDLFRQANIWLSPVWVILSGWEMLYLRVRRPSRLGHYQLDNHLCDIIDLGLHATTYVDRAGVCATHELNESCHAVRNELEAPCRAAITIDADWLALHRRSDEVGHCSTIFDLHCWPVSIEYSGDPDFKTFELVPVSQSFGDALALIVAGSGSKGVCISPVRFRLRNDFGIPVDF